MIDKILDKLGIQLNPMQEETMHAVLHGNKDVVVLSPTGSGKTLAYLMPLVQLIDPKVDEPQLVVVTPGRELALQSTEVLKSMGTGLRTMACYGGRAAMDEHRVMNKVLPQVIFGTPGRLTDHLDKGNFSAEHVKYLVIDEFDKCLEMGFQDEMGRLIASLPYLERHFLLSATEAEEIPRFVHMGRVETIDYRMDEEQVPERIRIYQVKSPQKDKLETLAQLLLSLGDESSIVFLNYRDSVERTNEFLRSRGFATSAFHGGLEQHEREDALYKFSNGSANIFVSTDLGARGLDIPDIDNIIHYHLPECEDSYIHRVGRTARWEATGKAFFLLGPSEDIPSYVDAEVEDYEIPSDLPAPAKPRMATIYIGKGKKDKISKGDIVGYLCKIGQLQSSEIGKIDVKDRYAYVAVSRTKLKQVLKLTAGQKIKGIKTVIEEVR
ncbi:MAG: DEAD/DEAH box helicase [Prevotella sp.]|jgi:ATP-independent RNA helicase DbpA|uniref:DEAD/DEAH box helicase n=1 Tax=Prevotella sp. TaxID=59823 RepID=UPI0025E6AF16|nr:DEAD/DEAH box helicase [Prevotella sp.]